MAAGRARATAWHGGSRHALEYAIVASIALHVLALGYLPAPRATARTLPALPPLEARLVPAQSVPALKPSPLPPVIETKPVSPEVRRPAARPIPRPKQRLADRHIANKPAPIPEPAPQPAQARERVAAPQARVPLAVATPAPRAAPAPAAQPAPARIEPAILEAQYRAALIAAAARYKRYPRFARDNGWEGKVELRLAIGPDGAIASLRVAHGSGYPVLDRQALEMVRNAKPETAIPEGLRGKAFSVDIPVIFSLRDPDA